MGFGVSLRSFGVLPLFIGHSMVLVFDQFSCSEEKTIFDAKAKSGEAKLETTDQLLTRTFKASQHSSNRATFNFDGCMAKEKIGTIGHVIFNLDDSTMTFELTVELKDDEITFTARRGYKIPVSCSPTFYRIGEEQCTIDVGVELEKKIPGMNSNLMRHRKDWAGGLL
ncbi:hypothetical protein M3Y96_00871800 [Aphelenchoides besseyi]|nr:hypothetical protein M3Y96_00871800 [Aphelenchoides besseyi]